MKTIKIGVCKGRHEMPCDMYVFDSIEDPTNVEEIEKEAKAFFYKNFFNEGVKKFEIYVTGLTVALIAVMKAADRFCDEIVLMHYDTKTGNYYPQDI